MFADRRSWSPGGGWSEVSVSARLIHGRVFSPPLVGGRAISRRVPSAVSGVLVTCLILFLVEVLISSLTGKNPRGIDIKPCVISVADIFLVWPFKHHYGIYLKIDT